MPWALTDCHSEALQKMKVRASQRELRVAAVGQPSQRRKILLCQVRAQALTPSVPKDSLAEVGFIRRGQGRHAFYHERSCRHLTKLRLTQHTDDCSDCRQVNLTEAIAIPIVLAHGLIGEPFEPRVPGKVHVRKERALPEHESAAGPQKSCERPHALDRLPQMIDGVDTPDQIEAHWRERRLQHICLENVNPRGSALACRVDMCRGQIDPEDFAARPDLIEEPLQCLPGAASRIQNGHTRLQPHAGDRLPQLRFGERVE